MPIAAGLVALQPSMTSALSMGDAATKPSVASLIVANIASIAPMGMFPPSPTPIPMVPAGAPAAINLLQQALSLGDAATIEVVSAMMAMAIMTVVPYVPPAGLPGLQSDIKSALSLGDAATPSVVATMIASAVVKYYPSGGVL